MYSIKKGRVMSDHKVKIEGSYPGRYRFEGEFHQGAASQPIRDKQGKLWGVTKPRKIIHVHALGAEGEFFQGIAEERRILATKCDNGDCETRGTEYLPFRIHCPDCLGKMEVIDVTQRAIEGAQIYTYINTNRTGAFNTLDTPIRFIDIQIPGISTFLKGYMIGSGEPSIGLKVAPVFRKEPTYTIKDLAWVVQDTNESDLREGWVFAENK
jgi:uncharacterized OB-fold protein